MKIFSNKMYLILPLALLTLLLILFLAKQDVSAQGGNTFPGAISSTNVDGTAVNQNFYENKTDVYLKQSDSGPSLPDGVYYFQVTNPSGSVLLSNDNAECRQLQVVNGKIVGAAGPSSCKHQNGTTTNGTTPVQLAPFEDTPNHGNEYKVHLIRQTSTTSISPSDPKVIIFNGKDSKTDNFKVKRPVNTGCGDTKALLRGQKFFDANANGLKNPGEPGLAGVQIAVTVDGGTPTVVTTDANGDWSFSISVGSSYRVCEILPIACPTDVPGTYWVQTAPAPDSMGEQCYSGVATDCVEIGGLDFGDLSFAPARGGLTLGFWSNKNGQAVLKDKDNFASALAYLRSLCLKDYSGNDFDPTDYLPFRNWLLNGNAVNMAYMLSVQLSATSLDVRYSYLNDNTIVDARSLGLGFVTIGAVRNAANTELCSPGGNLTFTGNPLRQDEEILKNALDAINNNRLPMATASPAGVCYPAVP